MKYQPVLLAAALVVAAAPVRAQQVPESGPAATSAAAPTSAIICPVCEAKIIVASTTSAVIPPLRIESARPQYKTAVPEPGPYAEPPPAAEPSSMERREPRVRRRDTTGQIPEAGPALTPSVAPTATPTPPRRRRSRAEDVEP